MKQTGTRRIVALATGALLAVMRLTPKRAASSDSDGSGSPGAERSTRRRSHRSISW